MAYSSTVLWDYIDDNGGQIPYGTYTVILNDTIDNYDELLVEFLSNYLDTDTIDFRISVSMIKSSFLQNYIAYTSWDQRSSKFYISGTTFQKTNDNSNQGTINSLIRIYGIKY